MDSLVERALLTSFKWQTRHAMTMRDEESVAMPAPPKAGPASLYVHVPFCEVLCPFCSFHRVQYHRDKARAYFAALRTELKLYHREGFAFGNVYVGGGTPTCAIGELVETLGLVRELYGVKEVSVETNPKDLRDGVLEALVAAGVNRLSVGVQSFDDRLLKEMERYDKYGSAQEIVEHLEAAAPHFATLNVDMIYNLAHQTEASFEHDLDVLLGLKANQVSLYPLMVAHSSEGKLKSAMGLPDPDRVGPFYRRALERLRPAFTAQSCWCFSRTKAAIDEYIVDADDYVGVGSGAFSSVDGTLYATTFSLNTYVERVSHGLTGITGRRPLSVKEQMKSAFLNRLFGLQLKKEWVEARWGDRFETELWYALAAMKWLGAITEDAEAWRLTDRGMYYWVLMMSEFFASVNAFRDTMRAHIKAELDEPELRPAPRPTIATH